MLEFPDCDIVTYLVAILLHQTQTKLICIHEFEAEAINVERVSNVKILDSDISELRVLLGCFYPGSC
jgi:hypothetical protein